MLQKSPKFYALKVLKKIAQNVYHFARNRRLLHKMGRHIGSLLIEKEHIIHRHINMHTDMLLHSKQSDEIETDILRRFWTL